MAESATNLMKYMNLHILEARKTPTKIDSYKDRIQLSKDLIQKYILHNSFQPLKGIEWMKVETLYSK